MIRQPSASAGADGEVDRLAVQHRQRTRQTETHRAHVRVRRRAERRAAAAEDLRGGQELRVNLEADDGLECQAFGPAARTFGVDGRFEGLEVVGEHAREFDRLRVVGRGVRPGAAGIQHLGRNIGTTLSEYRG